jgi:hypothetical protein
MFVVPGLAALALAACGGPSGEERAAALAAFEDVEQVFQHPRCRNCHIEGAAPLQFDAGLPHAMEVVRGAEGMGAPGLPCYSCHGEKNPPASYGPEAPPGAPHWALPPEEEKMAWFGLSPKKLCELIQDKERNGGRDFAALIRHVSEDELVLWGWDPGGGRKSVPVPHDQFVASFTTWAEAGGPCPAE